MPPWWRMLSKNIVYNARVFTNDGNPPKDYIGISKPPFKHRYVVHKKSFLDRGYNPTCLSEHIWDLKDKGITFDIKWTILQKNTGYNSVRKSCNLCLTEKLCIAEYKNKRTLINKRNELVNKCKHTNDTILCNYKEQVIWSVLFVAAVFDVIMILLHCIWRKIPMHS